MLAVLTVKLKKTDVIFLLNTKNYERLLEYTKVKVSDKRSEKNITKFTYLHKQFTILRCYERRMSGSENLYLRMLPKFGRFRPKKNAYATRVK
jgi:hypothetical protein